MEEIDESQYAFIGGAFEPLGGEENKKNKKRDKKNASSSFESKKRKRGGESESSAIEDDGGGEKEMEKKRPKKNKKKKNSRNKKKSNQVEAGENEENKDGLVEEGKVEGISVNPCCCLSCFLLCSIDSAIPYYVYPRSKVFGSRFIDIDICTKFILFRCYNLCSKYSDVKRTRRYCLSMKQFSSILMDI